MAYEVFGKRGAWKFLRHMRYFENFRENLRRWGASASDNLNPKWDPLYCLDPANPPYINSLIIKMPPASRGASEGLGG